MGLLDQKSMFVTGGSRGIGAGVVRLAMHEGADVAFLYRQDSAAAQALVDEMSSQFPGQRCLAYQGDVADSEAMPELLKKIGQEFGDFDSVVNNAGITRDASLARMKREQWDEVMATNLGGLFNTTRHLVLQMVKKRSGSIINMTSIVGVYGVSGQANYATSKAGIIGFTKALSKELALFGIRVNAVAPGFIGTDMLGQMNDDRLKQMMSRIPAGRLGTPEDVAHLVCFLASDRATYITGQVMHVDGGITL